MGYMCSVASVLREHIGEAIGSIYTSARQISSCAGDCTAGMQDGISDIQAVAETSAILPFLSTLVGCCFWLSVLWVYNIFHTL